MTFLERWFEEVWNKGREDAIDEMTSVDTKGYGLKGPDGKEVNGIVAFKSFHRAFRAAFSDIHVKWKKRSPKATGWWRAASSLELIQEIAWDGPRRASL